jgi:hypothetical protein
MKYFENIIEYLRIIIFHLVIKKFKILQPNILFGLNQKF